MYRAKDTFWAPDNRRIVKGDLVAESDPVVAGREDLFEEVVVPSAVADLRTRTAGPGEDSGQSPKSPENTDPVDPEPKDTDPEGPGPDAEEKPAPAAAKTAAKKTTAARPKGGTR